MLNTTINFDAPQTDDIVVSVGVAILVRRMDALAFVRQLHPITGEMSLALPQEMKHWLMDGEREAFDPVETAQNVFSKTGFELINAKVMNTCVSTTAAGTELLDVVTGYSADVLRAETGMPTLDPVEWIGLSQARDLIREGEIRDGHSLAALGTYMARR